MHEWCYSQEFADAVEELTDQDSLEKESRIETEDWILMQSSVPALVSTSVENSGKVGDVHSDVNSTREKNEASVEEKPRIQNGKDTQDQKQDD